MQIYDKGSIPAIQFSIFYTDSQLQIACLLEVELLYRRCRAESADVMNRIF